MSEERRVEAKRGKVLVIDDSEIALDAARATLEESGFRVVTESSGLQLPYALKSEAPDVVLLDVSMPGITGDKVVQILRSHDLLRGVPVLLYSDRKQSELERLAMECGADGYIPKSSDAASLARSVSFWIEARRSVKGGPQWQRC